LTVPKTLWLRALVVLGLVVAMIVLLSLLRAQQTAPVGEVIYDGYGAQTYRAEVITILEEGITDLAGQPQNYQVARVRILEGPYAGQNMEIDYGLRQIRPAELRLQVGEELLVTISQRPDGGVFAYFTDFTRTNALLWLLLTFVAFSIVISGWKAVRGLLGMAISLAVILGYIVPQILAGKDPVLVSITGSFVLLAITLYLVYGWTLKTHSAVLGTLIALILTGLLASYFMNVTRLTGFGTEDAMFLIQMSDYQVNLRGLLLGGILIGALGVLDDLVITQASVVFELRSANPGLDYRQLYRRAMHVGRDHVAATVNTLVLAYVGVSLPMLLLFTLSGQNLVNLLNLEFVAEEIVRTLVGSLGLVSAVPITTALSCAIAFSRPRLGRWSRFLGPEGEGHSHDHGGHEH
jgi:uncharacterized membrane protein